MDPFTIAAIASGAISLGKGIIGAVQAGKAKKNINKLLANPVQYKRPEEYGQELALRQQRASQSNPLWASQAKDNIGSALSQSLGAAEKGAISSNTYGKSVGDLFNKQIQAYQDLGMQSQQWQDKQKEALANTYRQGAQYSNDELQFKQNNWDVQMNQARGDNQAGATNLWNGIEGGASAFMNFAGTKYAGDVMKGLQGGNSASMKQNFNPNQQFSKPINNWANPQGSIFNKPQTNWPQ